MAKTLLYQQKAEVIPQARQIFAAIESALPPVRKKTLAAIFATDLAFVFVPQPLIAPQVFIQDNQPQKKKPLSISDNLAQVFSSQPLSLAILPDQQPFQKKKIPFQDGFASAFPPQQIATAFIQDQQPRRLAKAPLADGFTQALSTPQITFIWMPQVEPLKSKRFTDFQSTTDVIFNAPIQFGWFVQSLDPVKKQQHGFISDIQVFAESEVFPFPFDSFVKHWRGKKRKKVDLVSEWIKEKKDRRRDIEYAIYGEPIEYKFIAPLLVTPPVIDPGNLPQIMLYAQQQREAMKLAQDEAEEETELEMMLKDIL